MPPTDVNGQPWFRFSLRHLFGVVTATSIWTAAWTLFGNTFFGVSVALAILAFWGLVLHDWFRNDTRLGWGYVIVCGLIPGAIVYLCKRRQPRLDEDLEFRRGLAADPPNAQPLGGNSQPPP